MVGRGGLCPKLLSQPKSKEAENNSNAKIEQSRKHLLCKNQTKPKTAASQDSNEPANSRAASIKQRCKW